MFARLWKSVCEGSRCGVCSVRATDAPWFALIVLSIAGCSQQSAPAPARSTSQACAKAGAPSAALRAYALPLYRTASGQSVRVSGGISVHPKIVVGKPYWAQSGSTVQTEGHRHQLEISASVASIDGDPYPLTLKVDFRFEYYAEPILSVKGAEVKILNPNELVLVRPHDDDNYLLLLIWEHRPPNQR